MTTSTRPDLVGHNVLVTGASRGIGLAIVREFLSSGARVVLHSRHREDCEHVIADLGAAAEGNTFIATADLARSAESRSLAAEAARLLGGPLDVLVNNAGRGCHVPTLELDEENYRETLEVDLNACFFLAQEVGRSMVERCSGSILNVTSIFGTLASPRRLAYCVAKAGVEMMTRCLAIEWGKYNVRVNAIAPGYTRTEMIERSIGRGLLDPAALHQRTPLGRLADPDDIGRAAVFLASRDAAFITGTTLIVDGGWSAYGYI
jgi:NAD(P)-dependent dehydrogenase (short-subunit alcohol dehydrogenase family)